jgi:hypothetical protein
LTLGAELKPPRLSTGTPYSGPETAVTTGNVLTNPAKWAYGFTFTPTLSWNATFVRFLGSIAGATNSAGFYIASSVPYNDTVDGAGGQKYAAAVAVGAGVDERTYLFTDSAGNLGISQNGIPRSVTITGAGTGIWSTMPTTIRLGGSGTAYNSTEYLKRFVQCRSAQGCK